MLQAEDSENEDEMEGVMAAGDQAFSDDDLPADFDASDPFFDREDDDRKKKTVKGNNPNTVELRWLEHLLNHENMFETGVVRASEC